MSSKLAAARRIAVIEDEEDAPETVNFDQMSEEELLAGIEGLAFGDSPAQGAISGRRYINPTLKFTFEGSITVGVSRDDTHAIVTVTDTGGGIPAAEMPRLFERFHALRKYRILPDDWRAILWPGSRRLPSISNSPRANSLRR